MKLAQLVKEEVPILEYAQYRGLTPKKVGPCEYTLKEHDSIRINTVDNTCYRHATGEGGSIIDFVMILEHIDGNWCGDRRALGILRDYLHGRKPYLTPTTSGAKEKAPPPEKKPFVLPPAVAGRYNRVFAYLCKTRGIDKDIVTEFIHQNILYEDTFHNCVFVGYDKDNNPAYATRRGTLTDKSFKGEVANSQKIGIYIDNGSPKLWIDEAIIDCMSVMTLLQLNGLDYKAYNYLSLGCLSDRALQYWLPYIHAETLIWGLDNDYNAVYKDTGLPAPNHGQIKAALYQKKYAALGYHSIVKIPTAKDFNDDLKRIRGIS